jgi:hypothetical protein
MTSKKVVILCCIVPCRTVCELSDFFVILSDHFDILADSNYKDIGLLTCCAT